jgi:hypothetical protein
MRRYCLQLKRLWLILMLLLPVAGWSQNACVPQQAIGSRAGFSNLAQVESFATVVVSPGPLYINATSSTTIAGNTVTADINGNYTLCSTPASTQSVTVSYSGSSTVTYSLSFPLLTAGATLSGNNTWTGNNNFTGGFNAASGVFSGTVTVDGGLDAAGSIFGAPEISTTNTGNVETAQLQQFVSGDYAGVSACVGGTKTITFGGTPAYVQTPVILVFDETTHGGASLTAKSNTSFTIACTGTTDTFDWMIVANPD